LEIILNLKQFLVTAISVGAVAQTLAVIEYAPANRYSFNHNYSGATTSVPGINLFNPARGKLRAVRLRMFHNVGGGLLGYEVRNPNSPRNLDGKYYGTASINTWIAVTLPNGGPGKTYSGAYTFTKTISGNKFDGTVDYAGTSGGVTSIAASGGLVEYRITDPAVLSALTGTPDYIEAPYVDRSNYDLVRDYIAGAPEVDDDSGQIVVPVKTSRGLSGSLSWTPANPNGANTFLSMAPNGSSARFTLTYEYDPEDLQTVISPGIANNIPFDGQFDNNTGFNDPFALDVFRRFNLREGSAVGVSTSFPRSGNGSVLFNQYSPLTTVGATNSKADFGITWSPNSFRTLGNLSHVAFDAYRNASSTVTATFAPAFRIFYDADGNTATTTDTGYLIYESAYSDYPASFPTNAWTKINAHVRSGNTVLHDKPFWMRVFSPSSTIENYSYTLTNYRNSQQFNGSADILGPNTLILGIDFGTGSGWNGTFVGAVDNVEIGFGGVGITRYNFNTTLTPTP
jgi:hypothetical protein